jgi:hypothetical protein
VKFLPKKNQQLGAAAVTGDADVAVRPIVDARCTMQDRTIREHTCSYCGRSAVLVWPSGLLSCDHATCKSLSYARNIGFGHTPDLTAREATGPRLRAAAAAARRAAHRHASVNAVRPVPV